MIKPVYALVGTDTFLQLEALAEIVRQAPKDVQRIDLDGESADLAAVLDELRSFAMFSSAKLVTLRNAKDWISLHREPLENYVAKPASGSTLVLRVETLPKTQRVYKLIVAHGEVRDCTAPNDLPKWIIDRAKRGHQLILSLDAARLLAELVGADLGRLDNELAKLALQTDGRADVEAVARSVTFQREQEMWEMTGELASGRGAEAVRRWRELMQVDPTSEYKAVTWLTMWLEDVRSYLTSPSSFRNAWRYKGDRMARFQKNCGAIGKAGAIRLINLLADVDYRSKTGLGEMAQNVERFLLTVAQPVAQPQKR